MKNENKQASGRRWLTPFKLMGATVVLSVAALAGWGALTVADLTHESQKVAASDAPTGWGSEVFDAIHSEAIAQGAVLANSLIRPANACGLGASSCFRCHDGGRADAPAEDPDTAPWHIDHAQVNHSCEGCHQGNPRLMRENMAHRDLIANPLSEPGNTCASCHDGGEKDDYLARYLQAAEAGE